MRAALILVLLAIAAAMPLPAEAQFRRDRSGSPRDTYKETAKAPAAPADPFAALEHELPSLKDDLHLTPEQAEAWALFERDVRDVAETGRARRRHIMALQDASQKPPNAITLFNALAEDARAVSEGAADARMHLEALYARLDEAQRRMVDRRVVLSQSEPLGR